MCVKILRRAIGNAQGFDEAKLRRVAEEGGFELAFAVFVVGVAVDGDAGADAEAGVVVGDLQSADGDVQPHFVRLNVAERAGVEVARAVLQRGDGLHGDAFRRAGNRTAGVGGAQDGGVRGAGAQVGIDAAGHLQNFAVLGDVEGIADAYAVRARDFAQIVA